MLRGGQLLAVPLLVLFSSWVNLQAQIPGHWEQSYTLSGWNFDLMTFSDSLHGMIFADSNSHYASGPHYTGSAIIRTTDGGTTWHFRKLYYASEAKDTSVYWNLSTAGCSAAMVDSLNGYAYTGESNLLVTHDGGLTWEMDTNAFVTWSYFIRMFTPAKGRAISTYYSYTFATTDSGRHFSAIGNAPGYFYDAIFLDTSEYWVSYKGPNGSMGNIMEHTTDAGNNDDWTSDTIGDSIPQGYSLTSITQTPDRQRFYVLLRWEGYLTPAPFHEDFIETTDDGATWRIDSTLDSAVIYLLSARAPNRLWALLYPSGANMYPPGATSVSYSPDDGHIWYTDSTLLGDTLQGMFWPDSEHGFVTASKSHSLVVYRFVYSPPSGVPPVEQVVIQASIFPNPATRSFTISSGAPGARIQLFDLLGREVLRGSLGTHGGATLDVSNLPAGIYSIVGEEENGGRVTVLGKVAIEGR